MMSVRCLPVHFARLACYAFVILGFPVECVRPAADSVLAKEALIDDVCCCKTQMKKGFSDSPLLPIKDWKCSAMKQIRPDRPFWWHPSGDSGKCCWTSGYTCGSTLGFLFFYDNGGDKVTADADKARLCPVSEHPTGWTAPVDKTMAWNKNIEYLDTKIATAVFSKVAGLAIGAGSAAGGPSQSPSRGVVTAAGHFKVCKKAGNIMLGGAFDDIIDDLNVGKSMSTVPAGVSAAVTEASVRPSWRFSDGKMTSDWMHLKKDGKGELVSVEDVTAPEGGKCMPLEPGFGNICLKTDAGAGDFYMKAEVNLEKEVPDCE
mmetsp:Transcript_107256/g.149526  ORF Transcript_107256/g.149526 Transcript_107256/m.149526 type:complete len:317 (+) Transcript_107256:72-1022(+)